MDKVIYILLLSIPFLIMADIITITPSDSCCGNRVVSCTIRNTTRARIIVDEDQVDFTPGDNLPFPGDGFTIDVESNQPNPMFPNRRDFTLKISYTALKSNVNVSCGTLFNSNTASIMVDSTPCLRIKREPDVLPTSNSTVSRVVVSGLCDDSILINSTLQCNISLQCLGCSENVVREASIDNCTSNITFNDIPPGRYVINRTTSTLCGERIRTEPEYLSIEPPEEMPGTTESGTTESGTNHLVFNYGIITTGILFISFISLCQC